MAAVGDKRTNLRLYILGASASLSAAHIRNDAVGAEIIAAVHYAHPCAGFALAAHGNTLGKHGVALIGIERAPLSHSVVKHLGQSPEMLRAENEIYIGIAFLYLVAHAHLRNHTAAYADDELGIFLF